jgi:DNA-binding MarR family transcriptional regulator
LAGDAPSDFDLEHFLPYLLNQAAEASSKSFQATYKSAYGMTRTQWRILANLGKFGAATARDICRISHIEKTKVSRAVATLEAEGLLARQPSVEDRRVEILSLTPKGSTVFLDLGQRAVEYDRRLRLQLGPESAGQLDSLLRRIAALSGPGGEPE